MSSSRAESEKSVLDLATTLCVIDRVLGTGTSSGGKGDEEDEENVKPLAFDAIGKPQVSKDTTSAVPQKTLRSVWFKYIMQHYSFENVVLDAKEFASLSAAAKEYIDSEDGVNKLLSLKYFFPKVPQPNEKPKPLTNDQKAQNAIFQRRCRQLWRKALDGADGAVRAEMESIKFKLGGGNSESNSKMKAEKRNDGDGDVDISDFKLEQMALSNLGVKKLKIWIEEDEDRELQRLQTEKEEKKRRAKKEHENWLSNKDSLRIRMPDDFNLPKQPAMSYGRAMSAVRPSSGKGPQTTVEIMAGQGLRYVHATDVKSGDLERSRKLLLEKGHVVRENFEDENEYRSEVRSNTAKKEREENEKKLKEDSDKAYNEWLEQKEMRDLAVKYVKFLPPADSDSTKRISSNTSLSASISAQRSSREFIPIGEKEKEFSSRTYDFCVEVGKNLKKVDRTLLQEWSQWCSTVFTFNTCTVLWDSFEPVACDVHCASYSQIRDTFMKLLRPGLDFKQTFTEFVEKLWKQEQSRSSSKYEEKDQYQRDLALNKRQMMSLLRQMGISLKDQEMRALIAAFDSDSNGVVTLQEFLDFTGPKRDRHGGASACLGITYSLTHSLTYLLTHSLSYLLTLTYSLAHSLLTSRSKMLLDDDVQGDRYGERVHNFSCIQTGFKIFW